MTDSDKYVSKIRRYKTKGLLRLWRQISSEKTPGWPPGKALEYLVLRAFELEGAEVVWPFNVTVGDYSEVVEQIDGAVYFNSHSCLIECKDYATRVNIEPIAKLRNQLLRRPSPTIGVVFSRKGFTAPALTLAQYLSPQTILLWSGDELEIALRNGWMCQGLRKKYRFYVENGMPDYHLAMGV